MTDFSVPQRMSLGAFFIYFVKFLGTTLNIVILYMAYALFSSEGSLAENISIVTSILGCTVLIALGLAAVVFFQIKFHVEDGNIIYRHSIIGRATTTIPLNRIHTLRTRQGILYRILGLKGILFDTLAARGAEIELILGESDWQSLLAMIELKGRPQPAAPDMPPAYNPTFSRKFGNRALVLDALCQNHLKGMVVLGGFAGVVFDFMSNVSDNAIDTIAGYLESHFNNFADFAMSVAGIAVIMASAYVLSLVLWLGKVLLRYYDLSLAYDSKVLTFSHGLLSRMSSRFARDKICTLWIKRNYFEKRFGFCTLALKQALNSSAQKEEDNLKIYGRDSSGFFLGWWLGRDYGSETTVATAKSGKGVITHSLLPDVLVSSVVAVVLWHFGLYGWITLPAVYLMAGLPKGVMAMRHSYISLSETYLMVGNGRFAEITNYLKYGNVEVVRITRSPLTRFTGRVSLSLSTTGSTFTVRSLREDEAMRIYELLLAESAVCRAK